MLVQNLGHLWHSSQGVVRQTQRIRSSEMSSKQRRQLQPAEPADSLLVGWHRSGTVTCTALTALDVVTIAPRVAHVVMHGFAAG